jgi:hypothetical protein
MPSKITFSSAILRSFSRKPTGGTANFSASVTNEVREALGWTEIPDCLTGATPEGDLAATSVDLVPTDKELTMHRVGLDVSRVHKFEITRLELEGKKGKGYRLELRFQVDFTDTKGAQKLERYMLTLGEGKGKLTVSYTKQETLPLAPGQQADLGGDDAADTVQ